MTAESMKVSGTVARTSLPAAKVGRRATIVRDGDWLTVRQDGRTLGRWPNELATLRTSRTYVIERRTPAWAIALGILLLPLFLIGAALFFIKEEGYVPVLQFTVLVDGEAVVTVERHGLLVQPAAPAWA